PPSYTACRTGAARCARSRHSPAGPSRPSGATRPRGPSARSAGICRAWASAWGPARGGPGRPSSFAAGGARSNPPSSGASWGARGARAAGGRGGPGHRPRHDGGARLRRKRPAPHRHLHGLRAADRGGCARGRALRARVGRGFESARREGRRRGRHVGGRRRDRERGGRRGRRRRRPSPAGDRAQGEGDAVSKGLVAALRLLLVALVMSACVTTHAHTAETIDASLREEIHTVPVAAASATIVVTTYRPSGSGPFPWVVM